MAFAPPTPPSAPKRRSVGWRLADRRDDKLFLTKLTHKDTEERLTVTAKKDVAGWIDHEKRRNKVLFA